MTPEQLHQIDQARRYAEQDEYAVTRTHIRNLLAIIEQQRAEHIANSVTVCNVFAAFGEHYDERLSPADNVRRLIQQQAASVPEEIRDNIPRALELAERLVTSGPKCCAVSASETHEISDFIQDVCNWLAAAPSQAGLDNPKAPKS